MWKVLALVDFLRSFASDFHAECCFDILSGDGGDAATTIGWCALTAESLNFDNIKLMSIVLCLVL